MDFFQKMVINSSYFKKLQEHCNQLTIEKQEWENNSHTWEVTAATLLDENRRLKEKNEEYKTNEEVYKERLKTRPINLDFPLSLREIESKLKENEETTIFKNIIEYLKLDSHEFLKNCLKTITGEQTTEMLIYSHGALERNDQLIRFLEGLTKKEEKLDRLTGKVNQIRAKKK